MAEPEQPGPRTGGCLCGAVRYTLATETRDIDACHCAMCRRWTGAVQFGMHVPEAAVVWQGEEMIRRYRSSDWAERGFCGTCGGHLFYRLTIPGQSHLSLLPGTLDDTDGLRLVREIFADRSLPACTLPGEHQKLTEAETLAMFGAG